MVAMVLSLLGLAVGIGSLVCWILEIVAAFKREDGPLLGILSIVLCGLGGFIIGWIKHKQWGISNVMVIWTGLIVANVVITLLASLIAAPVGP